MLSCVFVLGKYLRYFVDDMYLVDIALLICGANDNGFTSKILPNMRANQKPKICNT